MEPRKTCATNTGTTTKGIENAATILARDAERSRRSMNGNWWSVIGQGFDFIGFTILSLDLYRDYSRYKRREDYRFAVLAYEQAKHTRTRIGDAEEPQPDTSVSLREKQLHELKASASANL